MNNKLIQDVNIKNKIIKNKLHLKQLFDQRQHITKCINAYINNDKYINDLIFKNNNLRHKLINNKLIYKLVKYKLGIGEYSDIKKDLKLHIPDYDESNDEVTISYLDHVVNSGLKSRTMNDDEPSKEWSVTSHVINKSKVHPI